MIGVRENVCQMLEDNYSPDATLAVLVWTDAGIKELANSRNDPATDEDVRAVMERIGQVQDEGYQLSGVAAELAAGQLAEVKLENESVTMPAVLLSRLVVAAEQALWPEEWAARDAGLPVPAGIKKKLAVVAQARELLNR